MSERYIWNKKSKKGHYRYLAIYPRTPGMWQASHNIERASASNIPAVLAPEAPCLPLSPASRPPSCPHRTSPTHRHPAAADVHFNVRETADIERQESLSVLTFRTLETTSLTTK